MTWRVPETRVSHRVLSDVGSRSWPAQSGRMACGLRGPTITEIERQHMKVNMNTISRSAVPALALAMLTLGLPAAQAADSAASQPAKTVHGVKLSSLCQDCGVVNDVHT